MAQTREIDGVLYEVTPFDHERWVNGDYDKVWHIYKGEMLELHYFKNNGMYVAVSANDNFLVTLEELNMQLLKAVKEEYRYMNVYGSNTYKLEANGNIYSELEICFDSKQRLPFQGITKYTLVNGEVKSAEFIPKDKVEEMLKNSDK